MANGDDAAAPAGWMSDVQRALAMILIGTLALSIIVITVRIVVWGDAPTLLDLVKTLQSALINMSMVALGFFFGNTSAKMQSDAGQQKVVEHLTSTAAPVAPPAAPTVVVAWWSLLTDGERAAVSAAAPADPKAASFMAAAQTGKATEDDLADLVSKNLLTQARADAIKGA